MAHAADTSATDLVRCLLNLDETGVPRFVDQHHQEFSDDALLSMLKAESERQLTINPRVALHLARCLSIAGEVVQRPDHHALGLMATGDALRFLGRYEESIVLLEKAGNAFLAIGDEVGWARTRLGWLVSSHQLGHGAEALDTATTARSILVAHSQILRAATLDLNSACVCCELGRYEEALELYDRAYAVYRSLGEGAEIQAAWTQADKAILLTYLGDFETALQLQEEARAVFVRHNDTISVLRQDQNIAYIYAGQGRYTAALQRYSAILESMDHAGLDADAGMVSLNMVECYLSLNRDVEALELAQETIERFERCGTPTEAAKARFYCALAHLRTGNSDAALTLLESAMEGFEHAGLAIQSGNATLERAILHLGEERWIEAMHEAERARKIFAERGLVVRNAQADLVRARAAMELGEQDMAVRLAQSVLSTSRDRDVPWLAHEGHHILGRVAEAQEDLQGALEQYAMGVASIDKVQASLAVELRDNFLADKLYVYHDALQLSLRLSQIHGAFTYLERMKSRALVDSLSSTPHLLARAEDEQSRDLLNNLARLREEHNWLYNRRYGYGLTRPGDHHLAGEDDDQLRAAIADREKRISRIVERLALDRAEGLSIVTITDTADVLVPAGFAPGTVLLEYYLHASGGMVFVMSRDGLNAVPLQTTSAEIGQLVARWQLNVLSTCQAIARGASVQALSHNARGILSRLYQLLVQPVASYLVECKRLVVVPFGPAHAIPFHALMDDQAYLLEKFEVSVCPSSSLLQHCSTHLARTECSALVMAFSQDGRLPAVLDEARAVAAMLPGELYLENDATLDAFLSSAPNHAVLHLASHAEARLDNPTFAHIQLAGGQLGILDVFNVNLQGALVTLSACETGCTRVLGGDELVGLSRGFLYAGASSLVQSLWRVDDGSTAELMTNFYRALGAGESKGAALRAAQLAMCTDRYYHPYYWAAFQIIGDSGPL